MVKKCKQKNHAEQTERSGYDADGKGRGIKKPNSRDEGINVKRFPTSVGRKEYGEVTATLNETDRIEAVDGRVKGEAQGMVVQAVETEKEGNQDDKGDGKPEDFGYFGISTVLDMPFAQHKFWILDFGFTIQTRFRFVGIV